MESKMDDEECSWSLIQTSDNDDAPRDQVMQEDLLTPPSLDYSTNNFGFESDEEYLFEKYLMGGSGPTTLVQSSEMDVSLVDYGLVSGGVRNGTTYLNAFTSSSNTCLSMDDDLEILHDVHMPDRSKSFLFQPQSSTTSNQNWMNTPLTTAEWDRIRDEETAEVAMSRHRGRVEGETKEGEQSSEKPWALSHWTSTAWDYDESH
jgi:hypothetical protein